jgi:hypothetical protein
MYGKDLWIRVEYDPILGEETGFLIYISAF